MASLESAFSAAPRAQGGDMSVLDVTQDDNIAGRAGDKLKGRVAFVTGGTRGIGAGICRSLASQGAVLAAGYAGNDEAAGQASATPSPATYSTAVSIHKGNVGEADDCRRTIDEVIASHGRLDILVNNAGITIDKTVLKMSDEDWFKVLNVNLSGAFFLSQAALRHMAERGSGRIVNVSWVIGEMGNIGQANYAASKSGLFGLTKTLAREAAFLLGKAGRLDRSGRRRAHRQHGDPRLHRHRDARAHPGQGAGEDRGQIPLGRLGKPEEVARVVHFLAADASCYITGQVRNPVDRLSRTRTSSPASSSSSTIWLPMKPAPPVTSTLIDDPRGTAVAFRPLVIGKRLLLALRGAAGPSDARTST